MFQNQQVFHDFAHSVCLGTWIITGGMNKGIMQIVGQLIGKYSNPARPIHLIVSES